jgi:DNA-binding transcriptional ArsR family regulator
VKSTTVLHRPGPANGPPVPPTVSESILDGFVEVFRMLADPSRLKILMTLADVGEMHVSALCRLLGHSQPAVSHHLALLRSHRLVSRRREGKNLFYAADFTLLRQLLGEFFTSTGNGQRQIQVDGFSLAFKLRS